MLNGIEFDPVVVAAARAAADYAREFGSSAVDTEHLLLGLLDGPDLFRSASNSAISALLQANVPRSTPINASRELPYSDAAVRALHLPLPGSSSPAPRVIRRRHVVVAILEEPGSIVAEVLQSFGIHSPEDLIGDVER